MANPQGEVLPYGSNKWGADSRGAKSSSIVTADSEVLADMAVVTQALFKVKDVVNGAMEARCHHGESTGGDDTHVASVALGDRSKCRRWRGRCRRSGG